MRSRRIEACLSAQVYEQLNDGVSERRVWMVWKLVVCSYLFLLLFQGVFVGAGFLIVVSWHPDENRPILVGLGNGCERKLVTSMALILASADHGW